LALTFGLDADIGKAPLCDVLISSESFVKKLKNRTPLKILNFKKKSNMEDLYPNILISLRILLTMPVSIASDKSFYKVKHMKTCLKLFVSQEILSSLSSPSDENTIGRNVDFSELVKTFADVKARKVNFH
jgi:hypothetical protein